MTALENCFPLPYEELSSDWDPLHAFGSAGDHLPEDLMPFAEESPVSSPASTGYLQDAVAPWRNRSTTSEELQDLLQLGSCHSNCYGDLQHISNHMTIEDYAITPVESVDASLNMLLDAEPQAAAFPLQEEPLSSSSSYEEPREAKSPLPPSKMKPLAPKECEKRQFKKMKMAKKSVAYPFAVVKPGGVEGDVTIQDINASLLIRPRWPVRHPVGDHAPRASPHGRGLSGKAIVGLTRIQTQGRGTITIIRTRG